MIGLISRLNTRINNSSDISESEDVINTQIGIDSNEEISRQQLHSGYEDDEHFYADHEDEFQEDLIRSETEELEYEYENVLNGSSNSFGIELEFVDGDVNAIARELYELGICGYDRQVGYHSPSISGKWKLEKDSSLGSRGGELISPPLTDCPETWQTIEKVCEVAKRHGSRINENCGGHIHQGISPLDTAKQRWKRFFKTTGSFEPLMYRFAGGDLGHVRSSVNRYATPFASNASRALSSNLPVSNSDDINRIATVASRNNRYQGINLTNIHYDNKPNTVEMRYFNSSLTPSVIQTNVKIANGILFASEKARIGSSSDSETMKRRGIILKSQIIGNNDLNSHNNIRDFVDIAFTRKKDKLSALKLYAKNIWHNPQ